MNESVMTLEFSKMPPVGISEPVPFVISAPSKTASKDVAETVVRVLQGVSSLLDQLFVSAISKKTAVEFNALWGDVFPTYANLMRGIGAITAAMIPASSLDQITASSLSEMESTFRDEAKAWFGSDVRDQAIFTAWTLRKINTVSHQLSTGPSESTQHPEQNQYASSFIYHGLRTRFGLDCLLASMNHQVAIYPDVLSAISDHLLSAVDAYAWIRQCADVRIKSVEPDLPYLPLDEEDRIFLEASASDMAESVQ
jgi:hypothetical protein